MFVSLALISLCPPRHANVVDALKMHSNFKKCIYAYKIACYNRLFYKYDLDTFKMHSNFKKCIYAYNLDALKMCSNFKKCTFAYKIVCYSRLIYKYDLDAMLML